MIEPARMVPATAHLIMDAGFISCTPLQTGEAPTEYAKDLFLRFGGDDCAFCITGFNVCTDQRKHDTLTSRDLSSSVICISDHIRRQTSLVERITHLVSFVPDCTVKLLNRSA